MSNPNNKKNLNSETLSKFCVSSSVSLTDPTHFSSLLGYRQSFFSVINPIFFQKSLKTSFLFVESFLKNNYKFVFIANIQHPVLFNKFWQICKKKNFFLLKDSETFAGFLTNKKKSKIVIITLFLDYRKTELIQKECLLMHIPSGNYNSFLAQNLILSLLSISLQQNYD